ncbi:MAG: response regulator, partial [Dehalococcoidia bacterium]|nr:response regulator [Dehalococcoidia bacterium]
MQSGKIKVIVADRQPLFRKGVEFFLKEAEDIIISAEASSESELLAKVVYEIPDVVLLDISLTNDGMELARVVKQHVPSVAVIVIATT